jgi:hypothetical protein
VSRPRAAAITEVLAGRRRWHVERADCLDWLHALPADSVDLVFGSPPYETRRSYGIDFKLAGESWVRWMVEVVQAALRCCRGLVAFVVDGPTRGRRWSATPALLMADLHRAGVCLRKPGIFHRIGIPGGGGRAAEHAHNGGGPDGLKNVYEFVLCATRGGKLPWADGTACGHAPRWNGGDARDPRGFSASGGSCRAVNGCRQVGFRPGHSMVTRRKRGAANGVVNGDVRQNGEYAAPVLANPGNVLRCDVGYGSMGSVLAHANEAPFPERLAEFYVRTFCPPGGIVADCFSGSGTTGAAALRWGRRFLGCDVRRSQVLLSRRRLAGAGRGGRHG